MAVREVGMAGREVSVGREDSSYLGTITNF